MKAGSSRSIRTIRKIALLGLQAGISCIASFSQAGEHIVIKILDSQTGKLITSFQPEIWTDHQLAVSKAKAKLSSEGTWEATLPNDASVISVQAQYNADLYFANCDAEKDHLVFSGHWYSVKDVVAQGITAPNFCTRRSATARPGELAISETLRQKYRV